MNSTTISQIHRLKPPNRYAFPASDPRAYHSYTIFLTYHPFQARFQAIQRRKRNLGFDLGHVTISNKEQERNHLPFCWISPLTSSFLTKWKEAMEKKTSISRSHCSTLRRKKRKLTQRRDIGKEGEISYQYEVCQRYREIWVGPDVFRFWGLPRNQAQQSRGGHSHQYTCFDDLQITRIGV